MSTENHVNESILNDEIKEWQKKNRIDHMTYLKGMEVLESDVQKQVIDAMNEYDYEKYFLHGQCSNDWCGCVLRIFKGNETWNGFKCSSKPEIGRTLV